MISGIIGNIGNGKTLFLTALAWIWHLDGADVYANYEIKGFKTKSVDKVRGLKDVSSNKNFFALDELWLSADSYSSFSGLNKILTTDLLQSRKVGADVACTVQDWMQLASRSRRITSMVYAPTVIKWSEDGVPLVLEVFYTNQVCDDLNFNSMRSFIMPLEIEGLFIPECYNTKEIVEAFEDPANTHRWELIEKYSDPKILNEFKNNVKKTEFASYLFLHEKITKSDANNLANYLYAFV